MNSVFERILITGGKGMLGSSFERMARQKFSDAKILAPGKDELDVTDFDSVQRLQLDFQPDLILHCAALVNAELCESKPERAREIIFSGTKNVVDTLVDKNVKFVYPQSFLVYDCEELPITETTTPNPSFIYGHEKCNAERYVTEKLDNHMIVVMAGFFGGNAKDKNFVGNIIPVILAKVREQQKTIDIGDRVWQPTFTDDLAANTLLLAASGRSHRYCLSSLGESSFAELASEIIYALGLQNQIQVNTVASQAFAKNEKAKRPPRAIVSNQRAIDEGLCIMRGWKPSLHEYLKSKYFFDLVQKTLANQDA